MILVSGATGILGFEIVRQLRMEKKEVRALTRVSSCPEKVENLIAIGAQVVQGDLKDTASLNDACKGVDAVITTATSIVSRQQGDSIETVDKLGSINLIDAAQSNNVKQFVYVSFAEISDDFPLQRAKRSVENKLKQSNMTYTVLRPTFFMETWLSAPLGFDPANGKALLFGSGDGAMSWVSLSDVAKAAVVSLDNPKTENQVLDLAGPEALSQRQVVSAYEQASGTTCSLDFIPRDVLKEKRKSAGEPGSVIDPFQQSIDALMLHVADGKQIDMTEVAKRIPFTFTSISDYIKTL